MADICSSSPTGGSDWIKILYWDRDGFAVWAKRLEGTYREKPSGYVSRFDFNEGRVFNGDEIWFYSNKRALCVHGSAR